MSNVQNEHPLLDPPPPEWLFLEPACDHMSETRMWCEDNVRGECCEWCGAPVYKYHLEGPVKETS